MQKPALAIALLPLLIAEQVPEITALPSSFPGQEQSNHHGQAQVQETSDERFGPSQFVLQDGTPVKLRLNRNVSSADAREGESVDFQVVEDVFVGTILVIPKGSTAMGTVTEAVPRKSLGRAGRLEIVLDYVRLKDTEEAPLRAVKDVKGASHTGVMTAGIVATGLLFWPAAPLFLFMHGKNTTIPRGAEITAYVNGELWLEIAKFETGNGTAETNATSKTTDDATPGVDTTDSEHGTITLQSTPFDCEITIDGAYVGYSPATLEVTPGKHTLRLVHTGYKEWTTEITLEAGSDVHLNAVLEDQEKQSPPQPQQ